MSVSTTESANLFIEWPKYTPQSLYIYTYMKYNERRDANKEFLIQPFKILI